MGLSRNLLLKDGRRDFCRIPVTVLFCSLKPQQLVATMAMSVPKSMMQSMMKDGAKSFKGLEEAVYRNIDACNQLTTILRSSFGPNGMNKMVINHLDKLFVTNDAATIIGEMEVQHPAAKMLVMASQMQEQECGDGTNWVLIFAGQLLKNAEELLKMGLSPAEVIEGYETAMKFT